MIHRLTTDATVFGTFSVWTRGSPQQNRAVHNIIPVLQTGAHLFSHRACQWQSLPLNVSLSDARPSVFSQYILDVKLPEKPCEDLRSQAALCR